MNESHLSKRLASVAEFVPKNSRLADIGSDHAYLPVALMLKRQISYAVAGEVVYGPCQSARNQVARQNLTDRIIVRLADGLAAIHSDDNIDVITICGMGGALICDILENGKKEKQLTGQEKLILQPNIGEKNVRHWLQCAQYKIINEAILEENSKVYEIIVAEKTDKCTNFSEKELFFGPELLKEKNSSFKKKWQKEWQLKKGIYEQLQRATTQQKEKIEQIEQEIRLIEEVLQND
ncbi:tRNA (adenine(22)-N(1))-methyltransferase TrmK [Melissococcus plutonius]|uniref:tRNA-m1A22 methylase n=3 Tax=Melissococcus plutonius TaxID=33970 RepID=F3YAA4_MELPT|nr:tRNA (adenine(22)-N(1))-methyltransferase TrmK [Melissococcus plutonius]BAL62202.1 putative tRNA-m1A22 methylase [Melissococcus plutonius DAT561]AIM24921.1 tRNA (adenine(22)-N(1))-methyltransferase TrmK [Melissococcus plutonius S1]KMT25062.1 tRNA (adenine(22)-N(1))-methyltransferase TrmK [Melissococcus plutonius]KMT26699.1 tRNA (adenine(22)-N(1))-methyltransferase TrmK [Melissococcus plutonius]KMT27949.1 tRNA (adenine(22)-N(1))-methyltransferase TrmK [Melissococcus plutonius]